MAFGSDITETIGNVGGRTTAQGFNSADSVRKQYTGYEHDDESGLDYAQARYYNSSHGRYTSIDPLTASASIRNPQTFNRYTYVLNSPYKFTDPLGLVSVDTGACGEWCRNSDGGGGGGGGVSQYQAFENSTMDAALTLRWGTISRQNQTRQDDPIQEASDSSVPVVWQETIGNHDVGVAQGAVEMNNQMTKTLGDNATEFTNLNDQISKSKEVIRKAALSLRKDDFNVSLTSNENGNIILTLTNPEGETYNYGVDGGVVSGGSSISKNNKITNVGNLVDAHNALVQKRNDLYTQRKTEFQNGNNGATLKVTSFKWVLSKEIYKRGLVPKNVTVDREFLGRLYEIRISGIAKTVR